MKEYKQFFGVDISKKTIDVTLLQNNQNLHQQFSNDEARYATTFKLVKRVKNKD